MSGFAQFPGCEVRARLDHPVIDADAHVLECEFAINDFLAQVAPDRFVAALMDCTGEQAERFGARVTRSVGARPILTGEKNCLPVQLSAVVSSLQFAAARFGDARAFVAAAEGQPAPVSIVERVRPDGRDVRMLRRELMKDDAREPLERAS